MKRPFLLGPVPPLGDHGKRAWLMTFRGEYHWKNPARADGLCGGGANPAFAGGVPCYYSTLGLAVSTDGGNTFRVAGESLQLTDPLTASKGTDTSRNIGYGSLVVADANGRPPAPAEEMRGAESHERPTPARHS
jgi:hypothetical protein